LRRKHFFITQLYVREVVLAGTALRKPDPQGGPRTVGYTARNPGKVARLVVLAPAYNRAAPLSGPVFSIVAVDSVPFAPRSPSQACKQGAIREGFPGFRSTPCQGHKRRERIRTGPVVLRHPPS
jgi:hypothetical protein